MRHSTRLIVLMFVLLMTGCGNQNPAGGTPVATLPTQKEVNEKHAANFLAGAKDFQQEGQPKHAVKTIRHLLDEYPESDAADEARQILAEIDEAEDDDDVEDGGTVENADRDKASEYFISLNNVQSAEEEAKLLNDFGKWLKEKGYAIRVEVKKGKHDLSCPYFPPVTPWTSHAFFDIKNLELLPRSGNGG